MARTLAGFAPDSSGVQDIRLDARGNLDVVDGLEDVRQRFLMHMRFFFGEWYLRADGGVPYRSRLFRRPMDVDLAAAIVSDQGRQVDGVTGLSGVRVEIEPATRHAEYSARIATPFGSADVSGAVRIDG